MSFDYTALRATAKDVLAQFGQAVTLRRLTPGAYDVNTSRVTQTAVDTVLKGVVFPLSPSATLAAKRLEQDVTDQVLLDASGPTPLPGDKVIFGSVTYVIVSVDTIAPSGVPVVHDCMVKS